MTTSTQPRELATFGGGCFWCLEAVFEQLRGVDKVTSGYAGGSVNQPTYRQVCDGNTGHAEVIQVRFDPAEISYSDLLRVFFATHDPTTLNRQGHDVGTQYRSAVFYHSEAQKETARRVIEQLNQAGFWDAPIVTELAPLTNYFEAEEYHQHYFQLNPSQPYCQFVVSPKVAKFRKQFASLLKR
jgi:peptide-methionine (S)-S-oxide reductase